MSRSLSRASAGSSRGRSTASSSLASSRMSGSSSSASLSAISRARWRQARSASTLASSPARSLETFLKRSPEEATAGSERAWVSSSNRRSMASSFFWTSGESMGGPVYPPPAGPGKRRLLGGRRQRLALLGGEHGHQLHRDSAPVDPFVDLPGLEEEGLPGPEGGGGLPLHVEVQGALQDVGEDLGGVGVSPLPASDGDLDVGQHAFEARRPQV